MRIPSGSTDRKLYFVAVDSTDLKTRETGLSSFTVYRSRDGGAATAYTTPTVAELSAANMPGVYVLTLDEDTTIGASHDTEEYCVHITQASMAPVTRVIDIYRVKFTEGQSATMANSCVDADVERFAGTAGTFASGRPEVNTTHVSGTAQTAGDIIADTNDIQARLPAALVSGRIDASVGAMATGVLTATAIAADAITDAKVASDVTIASVTGSVGSVTGAVGSVTGNVGGNVVGSVASVTAAVTVGAISANVVTAAALAADAVTEIQTGLSTLDAAGVRAAVGLATANLDAQLAAIDDAVDTEVAAIKAKTDQLTFTIAGSVDSNIQQINDVAIVGNGSTIPFNV